VRKGGCVEEGSTLLWLLVHNCTQALMRVRAGGFIRLETDAADEDLGWGRKRAAYY
jgi:hypothetical protein